MEREHASTFDDLDVEVRINLLLSYIERVQQGYHSTGKTLDNVDVNVSLKKAYKKLEKLMGIE